MRTRTCAAAYVPPLFVTELGAWLERNEAI
jgi:hypothetical protein